MKKKLNKLIKLYIIINIKNNSIILTISFYFLFILLFSMCINENLFNQFNIIYFTSIITFIFSIDNIFQKDYEDGSLILLNLTLIPNNLLIIFKIISHWINYGIIIIILSYICLIIFNIINNIFYILLTLIYSSLYLSIWSGFCGALILGLKQKSFIIIVIIIPIFIPILLFSTSIFDIKMIHLIIALNLLFINAIINIFTSSYIFKLLFNNN